MSLRLLLRNLDLEEPKRISGNFVEAPLLISYSLQKESDAPAARFFLQYNGSRIPLCGEDNDLCALLYADISTKKSDVNEALDTLGEPAVDQLLGQFAVQETHRKPIEHEIKSSVLVKVLTNYYAPPSAIPYMAIAPSLQERKRYASIVENIFLGMATGKAAVQVATAASLPALEKAVESISTTYQDFILKVREEAAVLEQAAIRVAKVGSDIRKYYQEGFLPLAKYRGAHEQLQMDIVKIWAQGFLTTITLAVASLNISLRKEKILDKERLEAVATLSQEAWMMAKTVYTPRFRDNPEYQPLTESYKASAYLALGFAGHARKITKAFETIQRQRERLSRNKGEKLRVQRKKASHLVSGITESIAKNRRLFHGLKLKGNLQAFDQSKELLLVKIGELEEAAAALKREYSL